MARTHAHAYVKRARTHRWEVQQDNYLLSDAPAPGTIEVLTLNEPQDISALSKIAGVY